MFDKAMSSDHVIDDTPQITSSRCPAGKPWILISMEVGNPLSPKDVTRLMMVAMIMSP